MHSTTRLIDGPLDVQLGDMTVVGLAPAKMLKALAVIAAHLHDAYDAQPGVQAGASKDKCLFCSLAVRDFLVAIGFADATVRGCALLMAAADLTGTPLHSIGVGVPGAPDVAGKFNGHAVVCVPSLSLLIDTTIYYARPTWGGALHGMFAVNYDPPQKDIVVQERHPFAGVNLDLPDRRFSMIWLDRPELRWKRSPDFVRSPRRRAVTRALIDAFGPWHD